MSKGDYEEQVKSSQKVNQNIASYFWTASPLYRSKKGGLHSFLRKIDVLKNFSDMELYTFSKFLHLRNYDENEFVFKEGDRGFGFYLVYTGNVKIFTQDSNGEQSFITDLEKYDFFGELSLLEQSARRSASVVAGANTTLLALYIPDFEEILNSRPLIGAKILKSLSLITTRRFFAVTNELKRLKMKIKEYEQNQES